MEVDTLRQEVANWKKRVTSLTLSFNAVDPEEHKQVKAEKQQLVETVSSMENKAAEAEKERKMLERDRDNYVREKQRLASKVQTC
ncbi:unnamed protein product [Choristocarpus tenellus]